MEKLSACCVEKPIQWNMGLVVLKLWQNMFSPLVMCKGRLKKLTSYKIYGSRANKNLRRTMEPLPCFPIRLQLQHNNITSTNRSHRWSCLQYESKNLCLYCWVFTFFFFFFFLTQPIIGMSKELSKHSTALKRLHMFRTTARFVLLSFS